MMALMTKAEPVWRWQSLQCQQWTIIGALVSRYRTAPQAQPPASASPAAVWKVDACVMFIDS